MEADQTQDNPGCGWCGHLIALTYGESTETETRDFEQHMKGCTDCSEDFAAFKGIRGSLLGWRQETLGFVAESQYRPVSTPERPSAIAAIREFFNLSPLWLKGAVVFASAVFCLLAVLAMARLGENAEPMIATGKVYSEAEVERLVESRTQERLQSAQANPSVNPVVNPIVADVPQDQPKAPRNIRKPVTPVLAGNSQRKPLTRAERDQLAADLRLTAAEEENDIDLLGDGNNR